MGTLVRICSMIDHILMPESSRMNIWPIFLETAVNGRTGSPSWIRTTYWICTGFWYLFLFLVFKFIYLFSDFEIYFSIYLFIFRFLYYDILYNPVLAQQGGNPEGDYSYLKSNREITIGKHNPRYYQREDNVELTVFLKNI